MLLIHLSQIFATLQVSSLISIWMYLCVYMIVDDRISSMMETVIIPVIQRMHRLTGMHSVLRFPMLPAEHQMPAFILSFANIHQMENALLEIRKK
jgi:hypothetical protein